MELEGELQMARDCAVMEVNKWRELTDETVEIRRMPWGLRKKVLEDENE